ncbi:unnamed protein product [Adineta steineri]|uniref:NAD(P)(+)--arginine ADP-ribosyltransferase n=1 Tax=Adineta steineri TaxID=433720 RepID=A0A814CYY3_9BILA|nr:unnamed protein product [Adineta steineri]CAF0948832.1 unnamed protein product [Adineta steineri]CAF1094698.1 unnamed protein product [Adineta steineri]
MASASSSTDVSDTKSEEMHLEIFCLLWLDASSSTKEGRDTEPKLRSIINHLKKFQDAAQCQKYIHERSTKERVVMIVSGRLGREIVPSIHQLRQVISIYVYCMDKAGNEKWARNYKKIKAVVTDLDELVSRIKADHKIQKMVEEPLSINIFTAGGGAGSSTTGLNGKFVFSQVLTDLLIQLQCTEDDKKELIDLCKKQYKGNNYELSNIRDFQEEYSSDKVLWWYTRESFFYKTLNAVLRRTPADIHTIFLFRKYIADIQNQLKSHQTKKRLRVYRSQMISNNELETLKQNCGKFISINSFFSTSFDEQKALSFLKDSDDTENLEAILFQIDADPNMAITKPFADITKFSEFKDEAEVLFMLGSIFRLDSVKRRKNSQIWIIEMTLCNDEEHDLKQVLIDMKEQFMSEGINLQTLAKILWEMSEFNLARKYFMRLLEQLSINDPLRIDLYQDLGKLEANAGDLDKSMEWRRKATELKKQIQSTSSSSVSKSKNPVGENIDLQQDRRVWNILQDLQDFEEISVPFRGYAKMPLVSLMEAVTPLISILPKIQTYARMAKQRCDSIPPDDLTQDESASIMLYSLEWEPHDECLYFNLNATLRTEDRQKLKPWFSYLKLILTALKKLPSIRDLVFRGVNLDLSNQYTKGKEFVWWGFSSCTTSIGAVADGQLLSKEGERTIFAIQCDSGKDISRHSYYQSEKEVLLLPARQFIVVACSQPAPGLHMIQLKETKSLI